MQASVIHRSFVTLPLGLRPTVGSLMALCEENYGLLSRLAPALAERQGVLVARVEGGLDLVATIEDQSRYTTELRLTYVFDSGPGERPSPADVGLVGADPDARIRAYHDARQVEILDLRQTALPRYTHYDHPALDAKWRVNLFLSKWLAYCLSQGYRFDGAESCPAPRHREALLPSLT